MSTLVRTDQIQNPYKFSVYRNAALNSSTSYTTIAMDTKLFDTGSNVDVVTNQGRFTAPVSGFYHLTARAANAAAGSTPIYTRLYKNGTTSIAIGGGSAAATTGAASLVSGIFQLSAGDYVEPQFVGGGGSVMGVGADTCFYHGFLVSQT